MKYGSLNLLEPSRPVMGLLYLYIPHQLFVFFSYPTILYFPVFVRSKDYSDSEIGKRVGNYFDVILADTYTQDRLRTENSDLLGCVSVSMC
jgi:hypothetical protein